MRIKKDPQKDPQSILYLNKDSYLEIYEIDKIPDKKKIFFDEGKHLNF